MLILISLRNRLVSQNKTKRVEFLEQNSLEFMNMVRLGMAVTKNDTMGIFTMSPNNFNR